MAFVIELQADVGVAAEEQQERSTITITALAACRVR
jgi:hypothetical protein